MHHDDEHEIARMLGEGAPDHLTPQQRLTDKELFNRASDWQHADPRRQREFALETGRYRAVNLDLSDSVGEKEQRVHAGVSVRVWLWDLNSDELQQRMLARIAEFAFATIAELGAEIDARAAQLEGQA